MPLRREHNIHFVLLSSFPRRTNGSIRYKVCTESARSTPAGLPGQPTSGEQQRLRAERLLAVGQRGWKCWKLLLREHRGL